MPDFRDIMTAYKAIRVYTHETPVVTSNALRQSSDHEDIVLKCENLQRTGCYNLRGAINHVIQDKLRDIGANNFVTHSTGNQGMAVAFAASSFDAMGHIVLPEGCSEMILKSIRHYKGLTYSCQPTNEARMRLVQKLVDENNNTSDKHGVKTCIFVHPQSDWVIAGNGTVGVELMLQTDGRLDAVLVPAAGGTLLAGVAIAVKGMKPNVAVFAAETDATDALYAFEYGSVGAAQHDVPNRRVASPFAPEIPIGGRGSYGLSNGDDVQEETRVPYFGKSVADEMRTPLTPHVAQYVNRHVDGVVRVTEAQQRHAFRFIYERCKLVIDAESATAVAALLARPKALARYKRVGVVLTGGNVELEEIPRLARM